MTKQRHTRGVWRGLAWRELWLGVAWQRHDVSVALNVERGLLKVK